MNTRDLQILNDAERAVVEARTQIRLAGSSKMDNATRREHVQLARKAIGKAWGVLVAMPLDTAK